MYKRRSNRFFTVHCTQDLRWGSGFVDEHKVFFHRKKSSAARKLTVNNEQCTATRSSRFRQRYFIRLKNNFVPYSSCSWIVCSGLTEDRKEQHITSLNGSTEKLRFAHRSLFQVIIQMNIKLKKLYSPGYKLLFDIITILVTHFLYQSMSSLMHVAYHTRFFYSTVYHFNVFHLYLFAPLRISIRISLQLIHGLGLNTACEFPGKQWNS